MRVLKAFTLIELLIVVAIIAILAAIAVPNFLEAQVRAKVSRVKADMRSAATAIEAYAVDTQAGQGLAYVRMRMGSNLPVAPFVTTPWAPRAVHDKFGSTNNDRTFNYTTLPIALTSPIAYITSTFKDPFKNSSSVRRDAVSGAVNDAIVGNPNAGTHAGDQTILDLRYDNIQQESWNPILSFNEADIAAYGMWRIVSIGPDNEYFGSIGRRVYDATNGTVSLGDVIRTQKTGESFSAESTSGTN